MTGPQDERRIVTALFADVVGSTALSERLDPEEARLVIGEALSRATTAVTTYGGTINKLLGDGLLALFGAPIAHEDDPERAIRAGLEIIAATRQYADDVRRSWGIEDFAMRVGIHTGEVITGEIRAAGYAEYGATGDTINTAARLEAAAASNEILVSDATQRHVVSRFSWSDPRPLLLKGKSQPVIAFAVKGLLSGTAAELPAAPMVGRESELATALALLNGLSAGKGAVLFIIGEPGIGKSRLAAELRERAVSASRCVWMEGRCVSYGETLPYWPYRDLLRNWLEVSPTDPELRVRVKLRRKTEELMAGKAAESYPYLATVLGLNLEPEAAAQLKPLSPESLQFRTFEVFGELLQRIASDSPVVVSLDDLHWADATSLALTEQLLGLAESLPLMLTLNHRPETDHPSWALKEKAAREYRHLFRELSLQPLHRESESSLLSSLTGSRSLPPSLEEQLLQFAEGNPFYLEQLIRSLIDGGSLVARNSHWELKSGETLSIPATLEGVIIARIDRLEPLWREVLTASSVLGRSFGLDLIQAVSTRQMSDVRRAVHHLLRLDLLREEAGGERPVYRFKHALIQETAYKTLVGSQRKALHRRAAEWYEAYYKDRLERVYGLIAHHWKEAEDHEKAASFLKLAGDRALTEWALDAAIGHFRALVPLLDEAGRQQDAAETLFQLGTTLHLAMRYREANESWQQAFAKWTPAARHSRPGTAALRIAINLLPTTADPARGLQMADLMLQRQLFETLLEARPGPYVVPDLAIRWEVSDDGKRYRLELDPAARRNDGGRILASDIVESFRTILDPSVASTEATHLTVLENADAYASGQLDSFEQVGVRALDERTVELRLRSPAPYWMFILLYPGLSSQAGQSSGPYRVAELGTERVIFEPDPGYQRGYRANLGRIELVPRIGDHALAASLAQKADVQLPVWTNPAVQQEVNSGRMIASVGPKLSTTYLAFTSKPPFQIDIHLRRALAYAIDRRLLEPYLSPDRSPATGGLVPPGLPGHTPDTALPFNPTEARESLAKSTHAGPLRFGTGRAWPMRFWEPLLQSWQEVLGLEFELHESGPVSAETHIELTVWLADYPDPNNFLQMLLHSHSSSNTRGWASSEFDRLIDHALTEESSSVRLALFHEADRLAVQGECSVIPLYYGSLVALHQPWVHGWWHWSSPTQSFDELAVDERSPRFNGLDQFHAAGEAGSASLPASDH